MGTTYVPIRTLCPTEQLVFDRKRLEPRVLSWERHNGHQLVSSVLRYLSTDRKIYYETLQWTQLIYLKISNITLVTEERLLDNISYYHTTLSLLLNLSHHWHELTVNLDIFKKAPYGPLDLERSSPIAFTTIAVYSFSTWSPPNNNRTLWLLYSATAEKTTNTTT